jgi:hypothetical protein
VVLPSTYVAVLPKVMSRSTDRETSVHRSGRLRRLEEMQQELLEALALGDAARVSRAREALERLEALHPIGRRVSQ